MTDEVARGPGQPTLYSPELIERIRERVAKGSPLSRAAAAEGIDPRTLRLWKANDPKILSTLKRAEAEVACDRWEKVYRSEDARDAQWMIDKRFTDPVELDEDAVDTLARRLQQYDRAMDESMPDEPDAEPIP